jgi:hypothetical protein
VRWEEKLAKKRKARKKTAATKRSRKGGGSSFDLSPRFTYYMETVTDWMKPPRKRRKKK